MKAGPRGNFIAFTAHFRKEKRSDINNITSYFRKLEKENQFNPNKETKIINIRTEINKI